MTYKIKAPDWMLSDASRIVSGAFEIGAGAGEVIGIGRSIDVLRALREEKKAQNDEIAVEVISWVIDRAVSELDVDTAISDFKSDAQWLLDHWGPEKSSESEVSYLMNTESCCKEGGCTCE